MNQRCFGIVDFMANYHLSTKTISRGQGRAVVAAAAYRRAGRFYDERYDVVRDYSAKSGVVHSEFNIPQDAPQWILDMIEHSESIGQDFWNHVEASFSGEKARLAREVEFSLPIELSREENIELAREFINDQFVSIGMVADWSIHWDNENNPHCHCLLTTRPLAKDGFGKSKVAVIDPDTGLPKRVWQAGVNRHVIVYESGDKWGSKEQLSAWREKWAEYQNFHLRLRGHSVTVDHRSYKEQGLQLEATDKIGVAAAWMEKMGIPSDRAAAHREKKMAIAEQILSKPEIVLEKIARQKSVFHEGDIVREVSRYIDKNSEDHAKAIDAILQHQFLIHLGDRRGKLCFTVEGTIEQERSMVDTAERMQSQSGHIVQKQHIDFALEQLNQEIASASSGSGALSEQQDTAARYLLAEGDMKVLVGVAGAGKSTILKAANQAWLDEGYRVRGAALSGIAAANLQDSGISAQTLHSMEGQWRTAISIMEQNDGKPLSPNQASFIKASLLTSKDILVIDEAGMVGTSQMQRILAEAERAGAKVVLVGDDQQLQSIEAGTAFKHIRETVGAVSLDEVRRQRHEWQREATINFATQKTGTAFDAYLAAGDIRLMDAAEAAKGQLVSDYMESYALRPDDTRMVLAFTRKDVSELNQAIQQLMIDSGNVTRSQQMIELIGQDNEGEYRYSQSFGAGDRIMFRENNKQLGVMNGTLATVKSIASGHRFEVTLDNGKEIAFSAKEYAKFQLGYAATVHKSQGVTLDETFVYASRNFDRHTTYVAMSRHRERVTLYADRDSFEDMKELKRSISRAAPKLTTLDFAIERGITPAAGLGQRIQQFTAHALDSIDIAGDKLADLWKRLETAYGKIRGRAEPSKATEEKRHDKEAAIIADSRTREARVTALRERSIRLADSKLQEALKTAQKELQIAALQAAARYVTRAVSFTMPGIQQGMEENPLNSLEGSLKATYKNYLSVFAANRGLAAEASLRKSTLQMEEAVTKTQIIEMSAKGKERGLEIGD